VFALSNRPRKHFFTFLPPDKPSGALKKGTIMSKKMMLLALAVAALFALPSAASAQEIHFKNVTTFTGTGPAGSLTATNEPKISCTATTASGSFEAGSSTTGTYQTTHSGCSAELLGIKGSCNTSGDSSGTITTSGTFHLITTWWRNLLRLGPGILWTPATTTSTCVGFSRVEVTGKGIIGTVTSPACGASSKEMKISFEVEGSAQAQVEYTGVKYDLSADTENAEGSTTSTATAAVAGSLTLNSATAGTLECT
jgi:hypothetical protein